MSRGSITAKGIPICPACGRVLEDFEVCECDRPLPRDGLRASCPQFVARVRYRGRCYISCRMRKLRFMSRSERDNYYMNHCCKDGLDGCIAAEKRQY